MSAIFRATDAKMLLLGSQFLSGSKQTLSRKMLHSILNENVNYINRANFCHASSVLKYHKLLEVLFFSDVAEVMNHNVSYF